MISCTEALNGIFFEDRHADKCIEYYLRNNRKWGSRDRKFFAETVYDCVRWWSLDWQLLGRKPQKPDLSFLAVSLWRRKLPWPDWDEFKGLDALELMERLEKLPEGPTKEAFPDWLYKEIQNELGKVWGDLAPYFNKTNELVIRVNTQKTSRYDLIAELAALDIQALPHQGTESGIIIPKRVNIFRTELFKKGLFEVQDGSSQQVATYLDVEPGMRVIDACAGAGGKSLHISDILQNKGKVVSLDIHQWKLDQLKLRARRNSYSNIEMKVIDGNKTVKRLKGTADRLLLDVPCSGLGVLRRNPDTKWKVSQKSLDDVRELQKTILQDYPKMLKTGGKLLYSTCSILPSENENQVEHFLNNNSDFKLLKQRTIYPTRPGYDGFFMALLERI